MEIQVGKIGAVVTDVGLLMVIMLSSLPACHILIKKQESLDVIQPI